MLDRAFLIESSKISIDKYYYHPTFQMKTLAPKRVMKSVPQPGQATEKTQAQTDYF